MLRSVEFGGQVRRGPVNVHPGCVALEMQREDCAVEPDGFEAALTGVLVELALDLARRVLAPGGSFVAKVFQGEGFDALVRDARTSFDKVLTRKPQASRSRSREVYLVARGFRGR